MTKRADIPEQLILELTEAVQDVAKAVPLTKRLSMHIPTVDELLCSTYPRKVTLSRMKQMAEAGLLTYGSDVANAWLTLAGRAALKDLRDKEHARL